MVQSLTINERDDDILRTLSCCVRLASLRQLARHWWSDCASPETAARTRLRALERSRLLNRQNVQAIVLPPLRRPLVQWQLGEWIPDFGAVAWLLQKRWRSELKSTTVYFATERAARRFGGRRLGRIPRAFQVSHDLGVAEMHFALRRLNPGVSELWVDEDRLAPFRRGEKLPDAVLARTADTTPLLVLEFGGSYGKHRLQGFHDDNEERGLPYQIW